jgi:hypothetical protein
METKDLEKDCEATINQVLTEQAPALEQITNEKTLANLSPQEQIALWRDKFSGLTIADMKDTKGYTQVVKAIALCRTTRTTLDKKRMEQKRFFLDAGKVIDSHYKELIALVEPIEEELDAKKKAIDDEKERIKQEKLEAEQKAFDDKVLKLIEAGALFTGVDYVIGTSFRISTFELKQSSESQFAVILKNAQTEAEMLKAQKEQEEREEKERVKKEMLDRRTSERIAMMQGFGFALNEKNWYAREPQSKFYKENGIGFGVNSEYLPEMEQTDFDTLMVSVRDDIKKQREEVEFAQKELDRKENELKQREQDEKNRIFENRKNQILALGYKNVENGDYEIKLPFAEFKLVSVNFGGTDAEFNLILSDAKKIAEETRTKNEELLKEDLRLKNERAEQRAQELLEQKEKDRKEKEEAERVKAAKKEARQPDKAKLNTFADRLEQMDIPEYKSEEANKIKVEAISRILAICAYIRDEAGKL